MGGDDDQRRLQEVDENLGPRLGGALRIGRVVPRIAAADAERKPQQACGICPGARAACEQTAVESEARADRLPDGIHVASLPKAVMQHQYMRPPVLPGLLACGDCFFPERRAGK